MKMVRRASPVSSLAPTPEFIPRMAFLQVRLISKSYRLSAKRRRLDLQVRMSQHITAVVLSGGETMSQRALAAVAAFLFALLQILPAAHAGSVLDRIKSTGVLVVATDPDWAPTSWRKENGDFDGMDVDVSREIARRMGVSVSFYMPYSFEAVVAGSWGGKWDIATSVTPTLERAEAIEFAAVYYYGLSSLAVHRDNADMQEPSEASGKRIGVVKGTEYEKYLTREPFDIVDMPSFTYKIDRPEIIRFDDQNALYAWRKGNGTEIDGI